MTQDVHLAEVTKTFRRDGAPAPVLRDISFTVARGERWGIIGRNGAGKTTLFRLVTGELVPASGTVARAGGLRISLMDQQREFANAATVWEAAAGPFRSLLDLERSLAEQAIAANANLAMTSLPQPLVAAIDQTTVALVEEIGAPVRRRSVSARIIRNHRH